MCKRVKKKKNTSNVHVLSHHLYISNETSIMIFSTQKYIQVCLCFHFDESHPPSPCKCKCNNWMYLLPHPLSHSIISGIFISLIKNLQVPVHLLPKFTFLKMMYSQNDKTGVFTGYRNQNSPYFPTMFKQTFK